MPFDRFLAADNNDVDALEAQEQVFTTAISAVNISTQCSEETQRRSRNPDLVGADSNLTNLARNRASNIQMSVSIIEVLFAILCVSSAPLRLRGENFRSMMICL